MRLLIVGMAVVCLANTAFAQGQLEVPGSSSTQSGIGIVSGWKCNAGDLTIQFDNGPIYEAAYGTIRTDTQGVCGDTNNGWAFLWNWNKLTDGQHTVKAFDNGVQFGAVTFTVQTLGDEFRRGLSKTVSVPNFPASGQTTTLVWQEGQQNFVIQGVTGGGGTGGVCTTKTFTGVNSIWTVTNPCQARQLLITIQAKNQFFVCDDVSIVQNDMQYDSSDYAWEDALTGSGVCISLLPGIVKSTILIVDQDVPVDFTAPFSLFFHDQKLLDFP